MVSAEFRRISKYWGKARKSDQQRGDEYHLLPYHCLDVASVAARWWDSSPALRNLFCGRTDLRERQVRAWVLFFIALHDLGKFDIRFQGKAKDVCLLLNPDYAKERVPQASDCYGFDHGAAGFYWFIKDYEPESEGDGFGFDEPAEHPFQSWFPWLKAVCGHHGTLRDENDVRDGCSPWIENPGLMQRDNMARQQWIDVLAELFLTPEGLSLTDIPPAANPLLAGFCSVSDWLGSMVTDTSFVFRSDPCTDLDELKRYFEQRYQQDALQVLTYSGVIGDLNNGAEIQKLLETGYQPRQLQVLVNDLPNESGLTLIEAPTGSGKTETALAYAWRLLESNLADSIIFALPTQATANAMLERMEKLAPVLFKQPNLVLAHGNSRFNEKFQLIRQQGENLQGENAWSQCCEWIGQSRKRVFLGQIGVCTIDQVLVSVLPLRHRFVRGFGVGRSVLIVDEVHAYDRYMYGLLEEVLRDQAKMGNSAILLSATLPAQHKQLLQNSYAPDAPDLSDSDPATTPYPLVSWVSGTQSRRFDLQHQPQELPAAFSVQLKPRYSNEAAPNAALLAELVAAASEGAQVCLICNRVDVAQQAYKTLQSMVPQSIELQLFHARFTLHDRRSKEEKALASFGKDKNRSIGRVLVATQVVEQSLDVDFDWLVTQICPVDLLFQRLGRLHRHSNNVRPQGFESPIATVLLPEEEGFGVLGKIYSHTRVMWRTQKKIEEQGTSPLQFPAAYRHWIESIYRDEPDEQEPAWVTADMEKFEQDEFTSLLKAKQMVRWAKQVSLRDNDANERAVTRDGAQSLTLIPYVDTPVGKQLLDGTSIYEQLDEYRQSEALALNQVSVPESWRRWLGEPDEYQRYWLEGRPQAGGVLIPIGKGSLFYSKERGMERTDEPVK
ncbi:MAG: CRISPR-associated helicase/endonuclease Cas3 [Saccharospirillaceae bacterium]|nr:CRISPR-associated helicase/endonuclease Cas3 [Saccharospirillaceae bacterium]MCD8531790.1 CRISPR-associated helicase/endonuclease Cas3 [Saccharospirillaceae bacterium]